MRSKTDEILFQKGVVSVNNLPFPKLGDKDKCQVMIGFNNEIEIVKDE